MFAKPSPRTYATVTMYTGMVATLAGNALAADWSDPVAVVISAFPALALFVVFEMVIRSKANPSRRRWFHVAMRLVPAVGIMGIAAWASYGHLLHVAQAHGQTGVNAYLMAALPDAMMILATVVLKDSPQPRGTTAATRKAPARKPATKTNRTAPAKTRKPAAAKTRTNVVTQAPTAVPTVTSAVPVLLTPPVPARRTRVLATN
jgi:hypothetical protein